MYSFMIVVFCFLFCLSSMNINIALASNEDTSIAYSSKSTIPTPNFTLSGFTPEEIDNIKANGFKGIAYDELINWVDAGFKKQEILVLSPISLKNALVWKNEGCNAINTVKWTYDKRDISDSGSWCKYGFVPDEAAKWYDLSFTPSEASKWLQIANFTPEEAARWKEAGIEKTTAKGWKAAGKTPKEAKAWNPFPYEYVAEVEKQCPVAQKFGLFLHQGANPYENQDKCYQFIGETLQLLGKSDGLYKVGSDIAYIKFENGAAPPMHFHGFVKGRAPYIYTDVNGGHRIVSSFIAIEVKPKAEIDPEFDKPVTLSKNVLTLFRKHKIGVKTASKWMFGMCGAKEAIEWLQKLDKNKTRKYTAHISENAAQWCKYGFQPKEAVQWAESQFKPKEAFEWRAEGIKIESARLWRAAGKLPKESKNADVASLGEINPIKVQCPGGIQNVYDFVNHNPYDIKNVCFEVIAGFFQLLGPNEGLYSMGTRSPYPIHVMFREGFAPNTFFQGIGVGQEPFEYINVSGAKSIIPSLLIIKRSQ